MSSCYITISYYIISYLYVSYVFCGLVLHCIIFNFISIDSIRLTSIYHTFNIVSHVNEWFASICLSVCHSLSYTCYLFFSFNLFPEQLPHTLTNTHSYTDTQTDSRMHMNICSFLWLVHITSKDGKWRIVFEWLYYLIFDLIR